MGVPLPPPMRCWQQQIDTNQVTCKPPVVVTDSDKEKLTALFSLSKFTSPSFLFNNNWLEYDKIHARLERQE